jgi:hypothetical protein
VLLVALTHFHSHPQESNGLKQMIKESLLIDMVQQTTDI